MRRVWLFLLSLLLPAAPAVAQFSSAIQGTVTDATQAAVPGAVVTVKNVATGISRESTTSAEGFYRISNLGPGTYSLSVQKTGFSSAQREALEVGISDVARADFKLAVGAVSERVEVQEQLTVLETEQGRVSGRVSEMQLRELPINGRQILNLIALQPGVTGKGVSSGFGGQGGGSDAFSGETGPQVFASGQRWEANNYTLDDTSTNGVARNGVTNLTPNSEAVEEIRVVSNNFSAVDGRNPGAQIQMITKGGTNEFHGSVSYYFQNNTLASRTIFEPVLPVVRKHLYNYAVGGPIVKNRTFFFTSFEGLRQSGTRATNYTVETPEFRDMVLQTRPNSIAARVLRDFAPAVYPATSIRDLGRPAPGVNVTGPVDGIPDLGQATFVPNAFRDADQFSVRVDHELIPGKDRIYGSYFRTTNRSMTGGIRPQFDVRSREWTYYGNLNHTHTFSPAKINEFRAGVMQLVGRPDVRKNLQIPGINITGATAPAGGSYPNGWWQTNYHYKDIFSWVRSTHTLKMGAELRHMRGSAQNTTNFIPTYSFNSILDFADDEPLSMARLVDPVAGVPATVFSQLRQTEWALFVQDDWKVSRSLTLNLGLRYENYGTFKDKDGTLRNLTFGPGSTFEQRLGSGRVDIVPKFYPTDWMNFAPRIGFAWDPTGKGSMTLRGGYGTAYDRLMNLPAENYRSSPPLRAQTNLGQNFGTTFTYSLGDPSKPFLGYPVDPGLKLGLDERGGIRGARASITTVDPNLESPYVHNWFFGIQRDVRGALVEANYIGSVGHKLHNAVNLNRFAGDLADSGRLFDGFNPSFNAISMVQSTSNSIYHGGTIQVKRSFQRGLHAQGAFTFGKAIDDTDQAVGVTNWQNAWDRAAERSLAGFDAPKRLSLVGLWDMPFFKDRGQLPVAHYVLGGWQLSGFAILESGNPFSVTTGGSFPTGDFNADGAGGDRPKAPLTNLQTSWTRQQFLNGVFAVTDFPRPAPGANGSLGRNTYRGPGFAQVDLSLAKNFRMTERFTALLRLDAFNAFNRVNFQNPNADLSNTVNFGRVTTQRPPRTFQAGLRIGF